MKQFVEDSRCDFCLSPEYRWRYFTSNFMLPADGTMPEYIDDGEWTACDECMLNVTYHEIEPIMERVERNAREVGIDFGDGAQTRRMIAAFFHHAIGGPVAYG